MFLGPHPINAVVDLLPETEYRFELDPNTSLAIKLVNGHAEIFGFELVEGQTYVFGLECKAAVFTWHGCSLLMSRASSDYQSEETPMKAYGNLHIAFEQMRVRALAELRDAPGRTDYRNQPPRVLVLGPSNSGKTTVCKILVNYAVRSGRLVRAWCHLGYPVSSPIPTCSPANTLGSAATSAPTSLSSNALLPIAFWYGHSEVKKNPLLMERLIRNLGEIVSERQSNDLKGAIGGLIVDTPSALATGPANTTDMRHRLIDECIKAFKINVILVVGHEKLNAEMQKAFGSKLTVVVELDMGYRERVQSHQLHTYMYGQVIKPPAGISPSAVNNDTFSDIVLSPSSTVIGFDDLTIYRIGAGTYFSATMMAPSDALPVGAKRVVSETQPVRVEPSQPGSGLLNAVLALLSSSNPDVEMYDEAILDCTIIGFLIITKIDIPQRKMTILAPNQGSFIGKTAIVGSYDWQDQ
ncbi:hypothetical protein CPB85DRAFT_1373536 [Mucidula mucida]|nr:hypothetical protein CPB85DRAFT_1373536 [Mucidula mucida]